MKTDKLNKLYDAHNAAFGGGYSGFHNALWKIMIDGCCTGAFFAMGDGELVVAQRDGGHIPCNCAFVVDGVARAAVVDDLNEQVFGLRRDDALELVALSMATPMSPTRER